MSSSSSSSSSPSASILTATQKYASGALLALALHQAQIHQTTLLGFPDGDGDRSSNSSSSDSVSDDPLLWVNQSSGLLHPVFKFLGIDERAWSGLEETSASSPAKHHIGAFLRLLAEESDNASSETSDMGNALANGVDAMASSMETSEADYESKKEKQREYEHACKEKLSTPEKIPKPRPEDNILVDNKHRETNVNTSTSEADYESKKEKQLGHEHAYKEKLSTPETISEPRPEDNILGDNNPQKTTVNTSTFELTDIESTLADIESTLADRKSILESDLKPIEEVNMLSYTRKVAVLYELLSACLATDTTEDKKKSTKRRKGYDARYRVALRLLATWFDIKWIKMEAIETIVACSAMAILKEEESTAEAQSTDSKWAKWKRGGIIGAAALTGGTLMAITGGLAAPAIAAGFSALAPTLGTIIPVIGASGFAAVATATGSVAGSVAVAASFGAAGAGLTGTKVARRIGDVDEFEFKTIGENHNQGRLGVEILVAGFVFEEEDFVRPWEGLHNNLESYALQWESKNLIAVSTAIQDWLTSSIALQMMKHGAMMTVLSTLLTALAWPATLLALTDFIDSKWTIAVDRSDKAGKLLAEVLLNGLQGQRPVTLVGFSLGARVIFRCLQILAENEANAGIVERVILLGAPIAIKDMNWEATRKVVAGRYVNTYSTNDWMLGIAFRANLLTQGLAGIQPVDVPGIENVDVTEVIEGHSSYLWRTQRIIEQLELDTYYPVFNRRVTKV